MTYLRTPFMVSPVLLSDPYADRLGPQSERRPLQHLARSSRGGWMYARRYNRCSDATAAARSSRAQASRACSRRASLWGRRCGGGERPNDAHAAHRDDAMGGLLPRDAASPGKSVRQPGELRDEPRLGGLVGRIDGARDEDAVSSAYVACV